MVERWALKDIVKLNVTLRRPNERNAINLCLGGWEGSFWPHHRLLRTFSYILFIPLQKKIIPRSSQVRSTDPTSKNIYDCVVSAVFNPRPPALGVGSDPPAVFREKRPYRYRYRRETLHTSLYISFTSIHKILEKRLENLLNYTDVSERPHVLPFLVENLLMCKKSPEIVTLSKIQIKGTKRSRIESSLKWLDKDLKKWLFYPPS